MIEYQLVESSPTRVVVRQPARSYGALFFSLVPLGVAAWVAWTAWQTGERLEGGILVALAFLMAFASVPLSIAATWRAAHTLRFDGATGEAVVQGAGPHDTMRWPLTQFASVRVRTTTRSSGEHGRRPWYHADAVLHDGTVIPVLGIGREATRDDVAAHLRQMFADAAARPPAEVPAPTLGSRFWVERGRTQAVIAWRTTTRWFAMFSSLVGMLGFGSFGWLLSATTMASNLSARQVPAGVALVLMAVPTLFFAGLLFTQVVNHRRQHLLRITEDGMSYESRGSLIPLRGGWRVTREQVASVRVFWGFGVLHVVEPPKPVELPPGMPKVELPVSETEVTHSIDVGQIPMGEIVALEQWLQQELTARWGRVVG